MAGIVAFPKNKRTWFGEIQCNDSRRDLGSAWNCPCPGSTAGKLQEKCGERRGRLGGVKPFFFNPEAFLVLGSCPPCLLLGNTGCHFELGTGGGR